MILPLEPTNMIPPSASPIISPSASSSGLGGSRPPSYHVTSTSGILTLSFAGLAGNLYLTVSACGGEYKLLNVELPETALGYVKSNAQKIGSIIWHAISPNAPVPKSHQPREFQGVYDS